MRVFVRLFVASLVFELLLFRVAAVSHSNNPFVFFPLLPAIWIGWAIGGVHSAGLPSFLIGLTVTAFLYAVVAWMCVAVALRIRNRSG
jgi:hypothetical protein